MPRDFDQVAALDETWKIKHENVNTTDRLCCLCCILAKQQKIDFPILATIAVPDANGVERWLCESHGREALRKRKERLEREKSS